MAMNGTDVLLLVNTGTPTVPVYAVVGSQRDVAFDENTAEIDVSSKDQREQKVLPGRYSAGLTLDQLYVPDDAGYAALKAAKRAGELILVAKQVNEVTTETGLALITQLSERHPDQNESTVSISMTISGGWIEETS